MPAWTLSSRVRTGRLAERCRRGPRGCAPGRSGAVATNSPFNEWEAIFNEPRLCAAIADRITFRCTLIQTGTDFYRFQATEAERSTGCPS
ncbi:ATP-binding protein [Streptomyces sp. NPDC050743]|uniref:ATP-binding protein n=1 Tax=Streptomyces sp. NPDC050743 TaxID=3365634 RepID=UPI0037986D81